MIKQTRDTTALVKDLNLQIDYLVGYVPSGHHWKQEYYIRKTLIDCVLSDEKTPEEIRGKIFKMQDSLFRLQNGDVHEQGYISEAMKDLTLQHEIKINHHTSTPTGATHALADELKDTRKAWWLHDAFYHLFEKYIREVRQ